MQRWIRFKTNQQQIHTLNSEIHIFIEKCSDLRTIKTLKDRLQSALSLVKVSMAKENPNTTLNPTYYAPNVNHETQLRFKSTRKKNRPVTNKSLQ